MTRALPLERWLQGATICLLVARPFTPGVALAHHGQGAIHVVLWLLLVVAWLVGRLRDGDVRQHFTAVDVAVLLLFAWHTIAGCLAVWQASPRPALNALWQWIAMAASYLLVRQLFRSPRAGRALVIVTIGLATAMGAIGLEQYFISTAAARQSFDATKDDVNALYAMTGQWLPPGSPERKRYEDRLGSNEPTATFALTNSLAGYLAPWLVVLAGIGVAHFLRPGHLQRPGRSARPGRSGATITLFAAAAVLLACLGLTKSRSGYLATLVGLGLLWPVCFAGIRLGRKAAFVGIVAAVVVALGIGIAIGGREMPLVNEAAKSLGYRLQYWQSTWAMIGDYPVFGCGPGQFQETYTAYKLPTASEEIADPHNFLMEVWATAGTPALLFLVTVLGLIGVQAWRGGQGRGDGGEESGVRRQGGEGTGNRGQGTGSRGQGTEGRGQRDRGRGTAGRKKRTRDRSTTVSRRRPTDSGRTGDDDHQGPEATGAAIYVGAAIGLVVGPVLAWLDQLPVSATHTVIAGVVAPLVVWGLHGWIECGWLPRRLPLVGIVTLLVHLLAAGGIGEPAIAGTLWILAALQMNATRVAAFHGHTSGASATENEFGQRPVRENRKRATAKKRPAAQPARTTVSESRGEPALATKPFRVTRRNAPSAVGLAVGTIAVVTAYFTAYAPVVRCRSHLARADATEVRRQLPLLLREVEAATVADRWSATAARRLANVRLAQWRRDRVETALADWSDAADLTIRLATRSARQWQANAAGWAEIWRQSNRTAHLDLAVASSRQAVARYPNDAALRVDLANLLAESGDAEAAQVIARTALRLDDQMQTAGHRDRFLSADSREKMERIVGNVDPASPN